MVSLCAFAPEGYANTTKAHFLRIACRNARDDRRRTPAQHRTMRRTRHRCGGSASRESSPKECSRSATAVGSNVPPASANCKSWAANRRIRYDQYRFLRRSGGRNDRQVEPAAKLHRTQPICRISSRGDFAGELFVRFFLQDSSFTRGLHSVMPTLSLGKETY